MTMQWEYCCREAGYDRRATAPERQYTFFAYKEGVSKEFETIEEAIKISKNVEKVLKNKAEIDAHFNKQRKLEAKAVEIWKASLRQTYRQFNDEIFGIMYAKAYEDGHASGYDEVELHMSELETFVERILEASKK